MTHLSTEKPRSSQEISQRLIVALDVKTREEALDLVEILQPLGVTFKVGMELFYASGIPLVQELQARDCGIFVDLKLHDIPNTVGRAAASLVRNGVNFLNVHIQGGMDMIQAAKEEASIAATSLGRPEPKVIGVTVLTSMSTETLQKTLQHQHSAEESVIHLAQLAKESGLDGVVCSAQEAPKIREVCGPEFLLVTPGIRPLGGDAGDQKRIVTPKQAIVNGADYLVVGRPITQDSAPAEIAEKIIEEMALGFSSL